MGIGNLALWVTAPFAKDAIFGYDAALNRDDCLAVWRTLRDKLAAAGWQCHTQDVYLSEGIVPDVTLFLDIPSVPVDELLGPWARETRKWVLMLECGIVIPRNWDTRRHAQFERIFTWNEEWLDGKKYIKMNFLNSFPEIIPDSFSKKEKLCTLIAMQQKSSHPLELYSKRVEAIRWFETNHPEDFDLYGRGWGEFVFSGPRLVRALNRIKFLKKLLAPKFPSYKGAIPNKRPVLEKYRFCICYENARDIPGYITEKIFDCFFAGCIPVYWGAPDIGKYIPRDCFVDKREFPTYEALYSFLKGMTDEEFLRRIKAIKDYIASDGPYQFSDRYFGDVITREAVNG